MASLGANLPLRIGVIDFDQHSNEFVEPIRAWWLMENSLNCIVVVLLVFHPDHAFLPWFPCSSRCPTWHSSTSYHSISPSHSIPYSAQAGLGSLAAGVPWMRGPCQPFQCFWSTIHTLEGNAAQVLRIRVQKEFVDIDTGVVLKPFEMEEPCTGQHAGFRIDPKGTWVEFSHFPRPGLKTGAAMAQSFCWLTSLLPINKRSKRSNRSTLGLPFRMACSFFSIHF
jgi:hypothetical protein